MSVVIPTHDRASLVTRAIESVLAQTAPAREIVVVDDGSTDDTRQRVASFGDRVRYLHQANRGVSSARNLGVRVAAGRWIAFLDSDDCWAPTHLANIGYAIEATAGAASLYFDDRVPMGADGSPSHWDVCGFRPRAPYELAPDSTRWLLLPTQPMTMSSSVVARRAYRDVGGLDERLLSREDTHLFFRLGLGSPVCAVAGHGTHANTDTTVSRLTLVHGAETAGHWEATIVLYRDVLDHAAGVSDQASRELRARLADGHIRMARLALQAGKPVSLVAHATRSVLAHPPTVRRRLIRFLRPG